MQVDQEDLLQSRVEVHCGLNGEWTAGSGNSQDVPERQRD